MITRMAPTGALPPGPRMPAPLQTLGAVTRPHSFLGRARERYGSMFTVHLVPYGRVVYLADPALIKEVFKGDPKVFHTGKARAILAPVLGEHSLLLLDEDEHLRQRKMMQPAFHGDALSRYAEAMTALTEEEVERWPEDEPFALRPRMRDITLEVILRVVIGARDPQRRSGLRDALSALLSIHPTVLLVARWARRDLGPWSPWGRFSRARDAADALLYEEIRARRRAPGGDDVLSLLIEARDADGRGLTDEELRDEIVTLLIAGHETTATGLAWTFERLMRHPHVLERLVAEIDADEDDDAYVEAVVKESLRLRPVVMEVARNLNQPAEIGGRLLPAGTTVMSSIAVVQRDPEHWAEPLAFRPERFLEGQPAPNTWIPFGGGTRRCIGGSFATFEMKAVLRAVLRARELTAPDPESEAARMHHVTFVPAKGALALARRRTAVGSPEWSPAPSRSASSAR